MLIAQPAVPNGLARPPGNQIIGTFFPYRQKVPSCFLPYRAAEAWLTRHRLGNTPAI